MTLNIGVGHSQDVDGDDAVAEAVKAAREGLGSDAPTAAIVFTTADYDHAELVTELQRHLAGVPLIGCSTDGQLSSAEAYVEDGIAVVLFGGDTVEFRAGLGVIRDGDDRAAGIEAARQAAKAGESPSMIFALPTGIDSNMDDVVAGLREGFGSAKVPVFGGTAADHWKFEKTFQIIDGRYETQGVPILAAYGPVKFGHGVNSGWRTFGRAMTVTAIEGNVLRTLDGQSAAGLMVAELGESLLVSAGEYPLAVMLPDEGEDKFYLRAIQEVKPQSGDVVLTGTIPQGAKVCLTATTRDEILQGSTASANTALTRYPGEDPRALLVFSCAARKWLLGPRVTEEYDGIADELQRLGLDIPVIGFYSYGELAPHEQNVSYAHNETCVTLALGVE